MFRKKIQLADVKIALRERRAVSRTLRKGRLAQGPEVKSFESEFSSAVTEGRTVVAVNSGTSGLHLGILASGIQTGDEVIVPSFSFAATANAVALVGARPVFCDIEPKTFTLDARKLEDLIGPKTRAIMPVHLFGHPAEMQSIMSLAAKHSLLVFEDAAQAHLAEIDGKRVGTFGHFAVFSLYPTKNMTSGEGGMVSFESEGTARIMRLLRNQGMEKRYQNEIVGFNNRMSDIHAAIGRIQLRRLAGYTAARRANALYMSERIEGVQIPQELDGFRHVYHQYTIRIPEDRDGFARALEREYGVQTGVFYPVPIHKLPPFTVRTESSDLTETDRASREVLSLPVHPRLSKSHLRRIAKGVNNLIRAGS